MRIGTDFISGDQTIPDFPWLKTNPFPIPLSGEVKSLQHLSITGSLLSLNLLKMGWDSSALRMESLTWLQIPKPISALKPQQPTSIKGLREIHLKHLWGKNKTCTLGVSLRRLSLLGKNYLQTLGDLGSSLTILWVSPLSSPDRDTYSSQDEESHV